MKEAQAKKYAQLLQTRFTYSTNGKEILQIDMETGKEEKIHNYPTPERLWDMVHGNIETGRQSLIKYHLKPIVAQNRCVITKKTQSIMY